VPEHLGEPVSTADCRRELKQLKIRNDRRAGQSVREIAAKLGVNDQTVRNWIDGKNKPAPDRVDAMLQFLGAEGDKLRELAELYGRFPRGCPTP